MEETVKRESIYNVPPATVLHTFSPAVGREQRREDTVLFKLKEAASVSAKVVPLVQRNPTSACLRRANPDQTHESKE